MRVQTALAVPFLLVVAACNLSADEDPSSAAQRVGGDPADEPAASSPADPPAAAPAAPPAAPPAATPPAPTPDIGAVFMISNDAAGNGVLAFRRNADGTLEAAGSTPTGGMGTGKGLGSQGAVILSDDGRTLLAVDAGSNELTSFSVDGTKLTMRSRVASNGNMPVSVTMHGDLVYVLNAGDDSCISGFRLDKSGSLSPIANSTHTLSAPTTAAAQVSFSPKGDALVVTEKATNVIDTFVVKADGTTSNGQALPSNGMTPFGFAFTSTGHLVISEAFGGAPGAGAMSSYSLGAPAPEHGLSSITSSAPDNRSAPCWVAITADNKWAFTSNTASDDISTYAVSASGALSLVGDGINALTGAGSKPIDIALDKSTRHLYVLNTGTKNVIVFDVASNGALTAIGSPVALPGSPVGLAAR